MEVGYKRGRSAIGRTTPKKPDGIIFWDALKILLHLFKEKCSPSVVLKPWSIFDER
jgi:hypothetical protein